MLNPFVCMYINNVICVSKVLYFFPVFKYFLKTLFGGNKKKRKKYDEFVSQYTNNS